MARIKKSFDTNGFPEKYYKQLMGSAIMEDFDGLDEEALKKAIVESETSIEEVEQERDKDEKLKSVKDDMKLLSKAYSDTKKFQNAKIKYALFCLEKKGKL